MHKWTIFRFAYCLCVYERSLCWTLFWKHRDCSVCFINMSIKVKWYFRKYIRLYFFFNIQFKSSSLIYFLDIMKTLCKHEIHKSFGYQSSLEHRWQTIECRICLRAYIKCSKCRQVSNEPYKFLIQVRKLRIIHLGNVKTRT